MKIYALSLLSFMLLSFMPVNYSANKTAFIYFTDGDKAEKKRLKQFAEKAKAYCQQNKMNENVCFIADMNLPAGK